MITVINNSASKDEVAQEMYELMTTLYPICRSITGDGVRDTLERIKAYIPLAIHEVATGTKVFDWTVPKEWNIKDAYIRNAKGEKIVDFRESNLHVLNYSTPLRKEMSFDELKGHLHTIPERPDWIPYRTAYYHENWGFCLSHSQLLDMKDDMYEVCIDSALQDGHLTYGEFYIEGESKEEVLISTHICHPSLCNDNLSGIVVSVFLARILREFPLKYSYRFLFIPATIGAVTWLSLHEQQVAQIKHGLVTACLGDSGRFTYKKSRHGQREIDKAVINVLRSSGHEFHGNDFSPYGYDERQYNSPGFNLPVGCLMRTPYGAYPEYHTSADNLDFVRAQYLGESLSVLLSIAYVLENNKRFLTLNPKCEPQLGRRGLYQYIGGNGDSKTKQLALLWVLNYSDSSHSLLDISDLSGIDFFAIKDAADVLHEHHLLQEC